MLCMRTWIESVVIDKAHRHRTATQTNQSHAAKRARGGEGRDARARRCCAALHCREKRTPARVVLLLIGSKRERGQRVLTAVAAAAVWEG